jgi:16S rRNA (cytosine967-C5)-methyltransferase
MRVSPARRAALEILRRVEEEEAYASVLLATTLNDLSPRDRALCHELVLGTLRRRLWLDRVLEHFAGRKIASLDLPVTLALRLGLYQLRFLTRIPTSAAVNESVNLVHTARLRSAASFVNAVLRRATREPQFDPAAALADKIERLSVQTSHPVCLLERWTSQFGETETAALAQANNQTGVSAFRLTARARAAGVASQIIDELRTIGVIASPLVAGAWRCLGTRETESEPGNSPAARLRELQNDGLIYFQDEASQLVASLVAAGDARQILDVCAAPGSKSTSMAAQAPDATVISGDCYESRVRTMRDLARLQQATLVPVVHDAIGTLPFRTEYFDRVLVDAPCSGTGTLGHNPEIRWRLQQADINELAAKQRAILKQAAKVVGSGGLLVYSTCSLEVDENEAVARDFLGSHRDFEPNAVDVAPDLRTGKPGEVRTWPHRHQTDGFFVAVFRRRTKSV